MLLFLLVVVICVCLQLGCDALRIPDGLEEISVDHEELFPEINHPSLSIIKEDEVDVDSSKISLDGSRSSDIEKSASLLVLSATAESDLLSATAFSTLSPPTSGSIESFKTCPSEIDIRYIEITKARELDYRRPKLTYTLYQTWSSLSLLEKLPYLLDRVDFHQLFQDFSYLVQASSLISQSRGNIELYCAKMDLVEVLLSEFLSPEQFASFWRYCDSDGDSILSFSEYAVCRYVII